MGSLRALLLLEILCGLPSVQAAENVRARYFLYSVKAGEGFNLRRDVYVRVAALVRQLRQEEQGWVLVLPPWPRLYHWRSRLGQANTPWSRFFDVQRLGEYVPVIEFETYLRRNSHVIDEACAWPMHETSPPQQLCPIDTEELLKWTLSR